MIDPTSVPTIEDIQQAKEDINDIHDFTTSPAENFVDSEGNTRKTIAGFQNDATSAIIGLGWVVVDSFATGATLTTRNQALRYATTGELYRWDGTLPKAVPPGSTPASSGGTGVGAWILVSSNRQVTGLKLLPVTGGFDSEQWLVTGFYVGGVDGGGVLVWKPSASKSTHNGVTVYAPEALTAWNGTHAGLSTLLNWTGSGSGVWVRHSVEHVLLKMAGAVAGGAVDDTLAVTKAMAVSSALQCDCSGGGSVYGVSGNITMPSWIQFSNTKLKQLTPSSTSRRTLFQSNGTRCYLKNIVVDRNGDGSSGSLTDAAGVWVNDCPDVRLKDVEVFGNDVGSGIAVIRCDNAEIDTPYIHDITAGTASSSAVTDDTIHGVWVQGGTGVRLINPRVKNLLNRWSGQPAFNRFSRGIAVGGAKQFSISSPMIDNVDQGIDLTGDLNPEYFEISGGIVSNCYTWGTKCANSVQNGVFTGVIAYRCGQSGFVASAPSVVMADRTQNITYNGCKSIQTGYGGVWTSLANVAGFRIADTVEYPDYPRSIKYIGCSADGTGGVMEYGFFNDASLGTTDGEQWIEAMHCDVQGATVANYHGLNTGYASRRLSSPQSISNSAWVDLDYNATTDYMGASSGAPSTTLNATRTGIYTITAGIVWTGNSNGTRAIRILVGGAEQLGSRVRLPAVSSNEFNMVTSLTVPIANAGTPIKIQVNQESGGALSVTGGLFSLSLISAGFGG